MTNFWWPARCWGAEGSWRSKLKINLSRVVKGLYLGLGLHSLASECSQGFGLVLAPKGKKIVSPFKTWIMFQIAQAHLNSNCFITRKVFQPAFFFFLRFYLLMRGRVLEEKQAPHGEPGAGLHPRTLGPCPELKARCSTTEPPRCPSASFLSETCIT